MKTEWILQIQKRLPLQLILKRLLIVNSDEHKSLHIEDANANIAVADPVHMKEDTPDEVRLKEGEQNYFCCSA